MSLDPTTWAQSRFHYRNDSDALIQHIAEALGRDQSTFQGIMEAPDTGNRDVGMGYGNLCSTQCGASIFQPRTMMAASDSIAPGYFEGMTNEEAVDAAHDLGLIEGPPPDSQVFPEEIYGETVWDGDGMPPTTGGISIEPEESWTETVTDAAIAGAVGAAAGTVKGGGLIGGGAWGLAGFIGGLMQGVDIKGSTVQPDMSAIDQGSPIGIGAAPDDGTAPPSGTSGSSSGNSTGNEDSACGDSDTGGDDGGQCSM